MSISPKAGTASGGPVPAGWLMRRDDAAATVSRKGICDRNTG
ncbi:hypothetical protein BDIM_26640 [Brevundimonas diminuta ATCC 11568]|nr:hypothetical protein BDIM_26640 [Brevundimonas diminuta ATCC 11568]